jgi:hypothetical protein
MSHGEEGAAAYILPASYSDRELHRTVELKEIYRWIKKKN